MNNQSNARTVCMEWFNAKENPPKLNEKILVVIKGQTMEGKLVTSWTNKEKLFWNAGNWLYDFEDGEDWMQMPLPPEKKGVIKE